MSETVVVVGGGYGGVAVATALDPVADVVLVEPRDAFVHNVAALRALVDPEWPDELFFPYDRLLARGRVVRARVVSADATGVTTDAGDRIPTDYLVLASGSSYPFPAKLESTDRATATAQIRAAHQELAPADEVLLLGAGPVGLELAGEIAARWPDKRVTVVDPADELAPGFPAEFRALLHDQLAELGIEVLLGDALDGEPPTRPGERGRFDVTTRTGRRLGADIWFRCFGVVPSTGYLADELVGAQRPDGHLEVTPELRLAGQDRVFALGDVTAVPEAKTGAAASAHAAVVATNITALLRGEAATTTHEPAPPAIALPLGPKSGVSYTAELGVLDAATTSEIKGAALMVDHYREVFHLPPR